MSSVEIAFSPKAKADHVQAVNEYIDSFPPDGPPAIVSLEHFAVLIGLLPEIVFGMTNSPAAYYRTFEVRKANGGSRRIDAPLPSLLLAQRWILEEILEKRHCHPAAKAYVKGRSIKENARFHRAQNFVLATDIKDFFGSISEYQIGEIFQSFGYLKSVSIGLAKICCLRGALPQGAATSGYLSNLFLYDFDVEMLKYCRQNKLRYSRYADDVTVSGSIGDKKAIMSKISGMLHAKHLKVNKTKTRVMRPQHRQKVTGVIVNRRLSVEASLLRTIRQELYYIRKFGIYGHARHIGSKSPRQTLERLLGQVSHAQFIRSDDEKLSEMKKFLLEERREAFGV